MKIERILKVKFELTEREACDVYIILIKNHRPSCSLDLCKEIVKALGYTPLDDIDF